MDGGCEDGEGIRWLKVSWLDLKVFDSGEAGFGEGFGDRI